MSAQMLRAQANGETFVSATMCPRLPVSLASISRQSNFHMNVRLRMHEYLLFKFRRILCKGSMEANS